MVFSRAHKCSHAIVIVLSFTSKKNHLNRTANKRTSSVWTSAEENQYGFGFQPKKKGSGILIKIKIEN